MEQPAILACEVPNSLKVPLVVGSGSNASFSMERWRVNYKFRFEKPRNKIAKHAKYKHGNNRLPMDAWNETYGIIHGTKDGETHSSLIVGKWTSTRLLNVSPGCIVTLTEVVSQQFQASISHKAGKAWNCLWIGNAAIRIPLRFVCVPSSETWSENYINSFSSKWRKSLPAFQQWWWIGVNYT